MPKFESKEAFDARREAGSSGDYPLLAEGEYVFEIKEVFEQTRKPSEYNETGEVVVLDLDVIADAEDPEAEILDTNEKPFDRNTWVRFTVQGTKAKPKGLGFGPAGAGKSRRVIASALGQNVNQELDLSDEWEELVGGRFIGQTLNKNGWTNFESVRAYKPKKTDRSASRPKPEAKSAAELIAESNPEDFEDLPF